MRREVGREAGSVGEGREVDDQLVLSSRSLEKPPEGREDIVSGGHLGLWSCNKKFLALLALKFCSKARGRRSSSGLRKGFSLNSHLHS